jgi:hypothetical protein
MKRIWIASLVLTFYSCNQNTNNTIALQNKIDSLETQLNNCYKPGFGEFMSGIQGHHAKLWFAGQHSNWKLADFEIHEIMEAIEDIKTYETDRKETESIGMINPAIDSVVQAIQEQNVEQFNRSFSYLTHTCVNCHTDNHYEFIQIKIPEQQTFSNQEFAVKQ